MSISNATRFMNSSDRRRILPGVRITRPVFPPIATFGSSSLSPVPSCGVSVCHASFAAPHAARTIPGDSVRHAVRTSANVGAPGCRATELIVAAANFSTVCVHSTFAPVPTVFTIHVGGADNSELIQYSSTLSPNVELRVWKNRPIFATNTGFRMSSGVNRRRSIPSSSSSACCAAAAFTACFCFSIRNFATSRAACALRISSSVIGSGVNRLSVIIRAFRSSGVANRSRPSASPRPTLLIAVRYCQIASITRSAACKSPVTIARMPSRVMIFCAVRTSEASVETPNPCPSFNFANSPASFAASRASAARSDSANVNRSGKLSAFRS